MDDADGKEGEDNTSKVTSDQFESKIIELTDENFEQKLGREHD